MKIGGLRRSIAVTPKPPVINDQFPQNAFASAAKTRISVPAE
jgi:hypothetical protein